jgi:hypothetical protein
MRLPTIVGVAGGLVLTLWAPAQAQLAGSHTPGDYGVQAGSQPGPGFYNVVFYYRYSTDTIKDVNGNTIRPLGSPPSTVATAIVDYLYFVSKSTIAGAHYGALVALPWVNATLEAPAFTLSENTGTRFGDLMVRPFELGWHARRADITTGIDVYLPTGRYEPGGDDNVGKGMVTYEPYVGTTLFLDEQRSTSVATVAFWQINGEKKHTNAKDGQILTLEGGVGKTFMGGGVSVGMAYYVEWKITKDQLGEFVLPGGKPIDVELPDKHKVWAVGPDVTLPVASKSKLFALVNVRYLWETGARVKTQGDTLVVTATLPIPSMKLK